MTESRDNTLHEATESEILGFFRKMKSVPENNNCFECKQSNPQWASVQYGVLICLECAGKHRGLGTHLSFVRSISMDTWNFKQLSAMRVGGNVACKTFFQKYGLADHPLQRKYESSIAAAYRAKIEALVEEQNWTDPAPEEIKNFKSSTSPGSMFLINTTSPKVPNLTVSPRPTIPSGYGGNTHFQSYQPKYGNTSSISSGDVYMSGNNSQYQNYSGQGSINKSLEGITTALSNSGQTGWAMAVDYFQKAKQIVGEGYSNLEGNNYLLGHGSGSSGFSQSSSYSLGGSGNYRNGVSSPTSGSSGSYSPGSTHPSGGGGTLNSSGGGGIPRGSRGGRGRPPGRRGRGRAGGRSTPTTNRTQGSDRSATPTTQGSDRSATPTTQGSDRSATPTTQGLDQSATPTSPRLQVEVDPWDMTAWDNQDYDLETVGQDLSSVSLSEDTHNNKHRGDIWDFGGGKDNRGNEVGNTGNREGPKKENSLEGGPKKENSLEGGPKKENSLEGGSNDGSMIAKEECAQETGYGGTKVNGSKEISGYDVVGVNEDGGKVDMDSLNEGDIFKNQVL